MQLSESKLPMRYPLPLAGIGVRMDLLEAAVEGKIEDIMLDDLALRFELQAT